MAIIRAKLSASTNGQAIGLTTLPTTIHTSTTAAGTSDEIHVWVANRTANAATLVVAVGVTGIQFNLEVPGNSGPYLAVPGFYLASGLVLYAHSNNAASDFYAYGFINRLTTGA